MIKKLNVCHKKAKKTKKKLKKKQENIDND